MGDVFLPSCSIIICTRDRPTMLEPCLAGVVEQDYPTFDIVVVDSAGTNSATQGIALKFGAMYVYEAQPGLSRARNRGVNVSRSDIVVFIDDDAIPSPGWLRALASEFDDPQVMAVTGRILSRTASTDQILRSVSEASVHSRSCTRIVVDRTTPHWFALSNFGPLGDGANMAFRRTVFNTWPGFDVRLGRGALIEGGEEHYAFFSLIARRSRIVYTPAAVVEHPIPNSREELRRCQQRDISAAAAYIVLLLVEHPEHWPATISHIVRWIFGARSNQQTAARMETRLLSPWAVIRSSFLGLLIYLKSRRLKRLKAIVGSLPCHSRGE